MADSSAACLPCMPSMTWTSCLRPASEPALNMAFAASICLRFFVPDCGDLTAWSDKG
eukprot:CAMPEP_0177228636 /NCGR_PEP_ID=MMETSP0367-20130122/41260_1 /TAXON_ID=447022 ORGANISM="Scrippsiella hangoei-like, Strain SHHI-4" /NCGR_SAMPLE_ID=MMETSP0367 /ASSEMBLY_ACC=CAM_ASM_000362 /LENGTH=56 /DNA_ID=CAMNT_0018678959 /DNA_START=67 /DNA_END=237 /DNA_ORIENTATION=+